jgi:hypothetical protein
MILQVPQADEHSIEQLQRLLEVLPSSHRKRAIIEADLRKMLSGYSGEKGIAYQLEFWYGNADDVVVANDLRIEFNGRSAQIDHIVALPAAFLVIESKSLPDHVYIDESGDWFRVKPGKTGTDDRQGMFSPIEQNKRHIAVLQDLFESLLSTGSVPPLANVIAFPNPKVVIKGFKPQGAYLVRIDNLQNFIERLRTSKPKPGQASTLDLIQRLLEYHRPISIDPYERYHIDRREVLPLNQRIRFDVESRAYICEFCGAQMALQKNRNGLFWGCPNYPQCKNLVPASIAVQVGTDAVEYHEKQKDFLTALFSSKLRLCPNCGSVLQWKKGRNKEYLACPNVTLCKYKG